MPKKKDADTDTTFSTPGSSYVSSQGSAYSSINPSPRNVVADPVLRDLPPAPENFYAEKR